MSCHVFNTLQNLSRPNSVGYHPRVLSCLYMKLNEHVLVELLEGLTGWINLNIQTAFTPGVDVTINLALKEHAKDIS